MTSRASLYDEDGIDGPFEREMSKPIVFDAARAEASVDALEAARDLRRNVQRAIVAGDARKPETTLSTPAEPAIVERHYSVTYYQPGKRGVWIQRFDRVEDAEGFAKGKVCWGRPAKVVVEKGPLHAHDDPARAVEREPGDGK